MHPFPHRYQMTARATPQGEVAVAGAGLEPLPTLPPVQFGGPGDRWSPETMLVGAIADCFTLTFRAVARAAALDWTTLECSVDGVLEREGGNSRFTSFVLHAHLVVPAGTDPRAAERALQRAEDGCLISNSLRGTRSLSTVVEIAEAATAT